MYPKDAILKQYEKDKPKGPGLFNMIARWYIDRHVRNLFSETERIQLHRPIPVPTIIGAGWQIAQAVKMIQHCQKPVVLIGAQAAMVPEFTKPLVSTVELLGAPVWLSSCGRGLLGAQHPLQFKHARADALREADLVILVGVVLDFRLGYGLRIRGSTPIISMNLDKSDLYKNRTPTLAILADPAKAFSQIGEALKASGFKSNFSAWISGISAREVKREDEIAAIAQEKKEMVNPMALCKEIENIMSEDAIIVADGGDIVGTFSYAVRPRGPRCWLDPGPFGTLGVGAGFVLGASCGNPKRELWLIWGDGACGFSIAEIDTFVRHKIPVICVVGNDAAWMQILRDQVNLLGKDTAGVLTYQDYHNVAKG